MATICIVPKGIPSLNDVYVHLSGKSQRAKHFCYVNVVNFKRASNSQTFACNSTEYNCDGINTFKIICEKGMAFSQFSVVFYKTIFSIASRMYNIAKVILRKKQRISPV